METNYPQPTFYPPPRISMTSDEFLSPSSIFMFSIPTYPFQENLFQEVDLVNNNKNITRYTIFSPQIIFSHPAIPINTPVNIQVKKEDVSLDKNEIVINNIKDITEDAKIKSISNTVSIQTDLVKLNFDLLVGNYPFYNIRDDFKNSLGFKFKNKNNEEISGRIFSNGTVTFSSLKNLWDNEIYAILYNYVKKYHDINKLVIPIYFNLYAPEKYKIIGEVNCSTVSNLEIFKIKYDKLPDIFSLNKKFILGDFCFKTIKIRSPLNTGAGFFVKFQINSDVISFTIFETGTIQARNSSNGKNLYLYFNLLHKLLNYFRCVLENNDYKKKTRNRKYKPKSKNNNNNLI